MANIREIWLLKCLLAFLGTSTKLNYEWPHIKRNFWALKSLWTTRMPYVIGTNVPSPKDNSRQWLRAQLDSLSVVFVVDSNLNADRQQKFSQWQYSSIRNTNTSDRMSQDRCKAPLSVPVMRWVASTQILVVETRNCFYQGETNQNCW